MHVIPTSVTREPKNKIFSETIQQKFFYINILYVVSPIKDAILQK